MADRWRVTSQRQSQELTPDGRFIDVMEVTFEVLDFGTNGIVRIPLAQYTAGATRDAIERRVDEIVAVHEL